MAGSVEGSHYDCGNKPGFGLTASNVYYINQRVYRQADYILSPSIRQLFVFSLLSTYIDNVGIFKDILSFDQMEKWNEMLWSKQTHVCFAINGKV